jgi:hypothetical protein
MSSNVSDVFPKILKLSSEVSECNPLRVGSGVGCSRALLETEGTQCADNQM